MSTLAQCQLIRWALVIAGCYGQDRIAYPDYFVGARFDSPAGELRMAPLRNPVILAEGQAVEEMLARLIRQNESNAAGITGWSGTAIETLATQSRPDYLAKSSYGFHVESSRNHYRCLTTHYGKRIGAGEYVRTGTQFDMVNDGVRYRCGPVISDELEFNLIRINRDPLRPAIGGGDFDPYLYFYGRSMSLAQRLRWVHRNLNEFWLNVQVFQKGNLVDICTINTSTRELMVTRIDLGRGANAVMWYGANRDYKMVFAAEHERVDGVWLPKTIRQRRVPSDDNDLVGNSYVVAEFENELSDGFEETLFSLERAPLQDGASVNDERSNRVYRYWKSGRAPNERT